MSTRVKILFGVLTLVGIVTAVFLHQSPPVPVAPSRSSSPKAIVSKTEPRPSFEPELREEPASPVTDDNLIGEEILEAYLSPATSVRDDLILINHLLTSFDTLVKASDALPLGANGDIADALRGRNSVQMRFLSDGHKAFNAAGEIIDRWQTPLYFHPESSVRIAVRSAGPDKTMWTSDDVHLEPNGRSFANQSSLLPPSLYRSR